MNLRTLTLLLKREATFACNCLCSCASLHDNPVVIIFFHFCLLLSASAPSSLSAWSHEGEPMGAESWCSAWMNGPFLSGLLLILVSGNPVNQWSPLHKTGLKCLWLFIVWAEWSPLTLPPLWSLPPLCSTSGLSLSHHSNHHFYVSLLLPKNSLTS